MDLSLADQYYIKALDNYPYNLEFAIENIQYALSYDNEHVQALCLLGQLYMYQMKDYGEAKSCFNQALKSDLNYPDTYKHLSQLYVWLGAYDQAEKLIQYGLKIAGMDRCILLRTLAIAYEYRGNLQQSKEILIKASLIAVNTRCIEAINTDLTRVKNKRKILSPKKKGKESRKK